MKKLLSILLAVVLLTSILAGCGETKEPDATSSPTVKTTEESPSEPLDNPNQDSEDPEYNPIDISIGGMTGPTSMGMVKIMEDNDGGTAKNNYNFSIVGSADEITPKLIKGELDIAAVPANLASVLYNNTEKKIQLLAVNTLGVVYIVEKGEEIQSFEDLKGKTIYATGKGSTPEYTLRYLLSEHGIDPDKDVNLEWKSEPAEAVALLKNAESGVAMMPQPYVTIAQGQVEGLRIAINLTDVWDELDSESALITGVVVVRKDFAEAHPQQIAAFLDEYKESIEYVNANVADAAQLIEKFNIFKAEIGRAHV